MIQRQLGNHAFELGILGLQLVNTPPLRRFQTTVLDLPLVVRGDADPGLATNGVDRHADVGLFERVNDLAFAETVFRQTSDEKMARTFA